MQELSNVCIIYNIMDILATTNSYTYLWLASKNSHIPYIMHQQNMPIRNFFQKIWNIFLRIHIIEFVVNIKTWKILNK